MEPNPRTSPGAAGLRPLGVPQPVLVHTDALGLPVSVGHRARGRTVPDTWQAVAQVEDVWRIAEEWWRTEPLHRTYVRVLLDAGRALTLFHDDTQPLAEGWYEQPY